MESRLPSLLAPAYQCSFLLIPFCSIALHQTSQVKLCTCFHYWYLLQKFYRIRLTNGKWWESPMPAKWCHSGSPCDVLDTQMQSFPRLQHLILHVDVFSAPCVLCQCCRDPECSQPHHCLYRWQNVFLEPGHALDPTGASVLISTLQHPSSKTCLLRNLSPKGSEAWFQQSALEAKTYFLYRP